MKCFELKGGYRPHHKSKNKTQMKKEKKKNNTLSRVQVLKQTSKLKCPKQLEWSLGSHRFSGPVDEKVLVVKILTAVEENCRQAKCDFCQKNMLSVRMIVGKSSSNAHATTSED